jgi:class 3 adenylate cyclase
MCALYKGIEIPDDDADRVKAVESYEILDTDPEQDFDDITELAASLTGCKVSYIGFFDDKRLWLKAKYGLPPDLTERPRELTLCSPTICQSDLLMVPDMSRDPRYAELPSVKHPPNARFYCAMPLINPEGFALGTLCVWDTAVMELAPPVQQCMRRLARQVLSKLELRRRLIELRAQNAAALAALESERAGAGRSAQLVRDLFPAALATRILEGEPVEPRFFASATIVFIDFEGFTTLAESTEPRVLIEQLGDFFTVFDRIVEKHGLEKIKTIGDGYLAAAGLPSETSDHARRACLAALEIRQAMEKRNAERRRLLLPEWPLRIGIHSGSVIAGIVGASRMTYDLWGDAVNLAARLQESCEAGRINISEATLGLIGDAFAVRPRGRIEVKNKGPVKMFYLLSRAQG